MTGPGSVGLGFLASPTPTASELRPAASPGLVTCYVLLSIEHSLWKAWGIPWKYVCLAAHTQPRSELGWLVLLHRLFCLALTLWCIVTPRLAWSVSLPLFAHLDLYLLVCFLENTPLYCIHCLLLSVAEAAVRGPGRPLQGPTEG